MIILYLLLALLTVKQTVGMAPLTIAPKVHLHPKFKAGTVCLIWTHEDGEGSSDCWTVEDPPRRTWDKRIVLRTQGVWYVEVTEVGQDVDGNAMAIRSDPQRVEVF